MIFIPAEKHRILDCVANTGIDVSGWYDTEGEPSSNPKYCYEWSYGDVHRSIFVFNVWVEEIGTEEEQAIVRMNARKSAEIVTPAKSSRYHRALRTDSNLAMAYFHNAAVRLIVIDGDRDAEKQRVHRRELDPVAWKVESYDQMTGSGKLIRGQLRPKKPQQEAA